MASIKLIFSVNLKRLMREKKLKAKELADKLNVTKQAVTAWRMGEAMPSPEKIEQIRQIMKVPYTEFFREDVDPAPFNSPKELEEFVEVLAKAYGYEKKKGSKK